eukprot:280553-Chlamydomonas_euryale.AAC.1
MPCNVMLYCLESRQPLQHGVVVAEVQLAGGCRRKIKRIAHAAREICVVVSMLVSQPGHNFRQHAWIAAQHS